MALAAIALKTGDFERAAQLVLPLEADESDAGIDMAGGIVAFYAALVYEEWAREAWAFFHGTIRRVGRMG